MYWNDLFVYMVNRYVSCSIHKKRITWKELLELESKFSIGEWCLSRDFNSINKRSKKKGKMVAINRSDMIEFYNFIRNF